jgi:phosphate transport system substrate-binding protein
MLVDRSATRIAALFALALVVGSSVACGGSAKTAPTPDPFAGLYTATGGGGALAAVQALTKRFSDLHPGVNWQVDETGSDAGINLAAAGQVDFGFVSRALTVAESPKLKTLNIGLSGTGVIVNSANPLKNLTKDQVRRIFSGEIKNWSEVGWEDLEIKVFIREANAATRTTFESYFFGGRATYTKDASEVFELEQTLKAVGSFRASIGMATSSSRTANEPTVHLLSIDNIFPSPENLVNGSYKIGRPLMIVFLPDESKLKPAVRAFLDFVRSPEGQAVAAGAS